MAEDDWAEAEDNCEAAVLEEGGWICDFALALEAGADAAILTELACAGVALR